MFAHAQSLDADAVFEDGFDFLDGVIVMPMLFTTSNLPLDLLIEELRRYLFLRHLS